MPEEYLTVTAARLTMGISEGKIASMIKSGELPTIPNPRNKASKLIPKTAVDQWIERASVVPPPQRKKRTEDADEGKKKKRPAAA